LHGVVGFAELKEHAMAFTAVTKVCSFLQASRAMTTPLIGSSRSASVTMVPVRRAVAKVLNSKFLVLVAVLSNQLQLSVETAFQGHITLVGGTFQGHIALQQWDNQDCYSSVHQFSTIYFSNDLVR
jgi:hypothetical protein